MSKAFYKGHKTCKIQHIHQIYRFSWYSCYKKERVKTIIAIKPLKYIVLNSFTFITKISPDVREDFMDYLIYSGFQKFWKHLIFKNFCKVIIFNKGKNYFVD